MGLDIEFMARRNVVCPHCGKVTSVVESNAVCSNGRGWCPILEQIGYYVPYEQRTEENDWYGKDMVLTDQQVKEVYEFVKAHPDLYDSSAVLGLIAVARCDKEAVVVNASW